MEAEVSKNTPAGFPETTRRGGPHHATPRQLGGGFVNVPKIKCPIFQVETKHKMPLPTIHKDKSHIQTADYSHIILKMNMKRIIITRDIIQPRFSIQKSLAS